MRMKLTFLETAMGEWGAIRRLLGVLCGTALEEDEDPNEEEDERVHGRGLGWVFRSCPQEYALKSALFIPAKGYSENPPLDCAKRWKNPDQSSL